MKIVMVASEMAPYSKTGGLADAVGGLSKELATRGHQVFCIVPYYRCSWDVAGAKQTGMKLTVTVGQKQVTADIWEAAPNSAGREDQPRRNGGAGGVTVIFVRRDEYFDRSELYSTMDRDYEDNAERFIFFAKVAVE